MNAPSLFDPALGEKQKTNLANRWTYVMDGMVSMGALPATDRAVAAYAAAHPHSPLAQLSAGHATGQARFLVRAIEAGDAGAAALLDTTAADIAYALSYVVHLMSPAVIVIGGGLSLLGEPLRLRVEQALPRFLARVFAQHPTPIRLAALGEDVVAVGALLLAQQAAE